MDHVTALHKTLIQHKIAFQRLLLPFPLHFQFPCSLPPLGRCRLVPFAFSTSVAMETCLLFFPLLSYQVGLLDSAPRPPLYNLNILSMFRQIWWKMLFTFFFPQCYSCTFCAIYFLWIYPCSKRDPFPPFPIIALKKYCIIWSDF